MLHPSSLTALAIPAACFLAGYTLHYLLSQKPPKSKFHLDSTFACLTKLKSPITKTTTWINLGLWTSNDLTYPAACEQLAVRLGNAAKLNPNDSVLDVGCGRGDQCLLWHMHFKVPSVVGIDITSDHVASAKQLVESVGLSQHIQISQQCASSLTNLCLERPISKIVSCDAAYHFNTRAAFLADTFGLLKQGGVLALVDFVVSEEVLQWSGMEHIQLRGLCSMAGIPFENLRTIDQYRSDWESSGYTNVEIEVLDEVINGFPEFAKRQLEFLKEWDLAEGFDKFKLVGQVLSVCAQHKCLQFVVASGVKP